MDLDEIYKSIKEKEEWDISCFCVGLHKNPGHEDSTVLPTQVDLTSWLPTAVVPFLNTGGGRKVC